MSAQKVTESVQTNGLKVADFQGFVSVMDAEGNNRDLRINDTVRVGEVLFFHAGSSLILQSSEDTFVISDVVTFLLPEVSELKAQIEIQSYASEWIFEQEDMVEAQLSTLLEADGEKNQEPSELETALISQNVNTLDRIERVENVVNSADAETLVLRANPDSLEVMDREDMVSLMIHNLQEDSISFLLDGFAISEASEAPEFFADEASDIVLEDVLYADDQLISELGMDEEVSSKVLEVFEVTSIETGGFDQMLLEVSSDSLAHIPDQSLQDIEHYQYAWVE